MNNHSPNMRKLINLVEMRLVDGTFSSPSLQDLVRLVDKGDLRGCGVDGAVYLIYAYDDTHVGLRGDLGLPRMSEPFADEDEDGSGFNFYVARMTDDGDEEGRSDWSFGQNDFMVGDIRIVTDMDQEVCLANRQFARMIGR